MRAPRRSWRGAREYGKAAMSKVRVQIFALSLDGFGAGPRQSLQNPLGERGPHRRLARPGRSDEHDAGPGVVAERHAGSLVQPTRAALAVNKGALYDERVYRVEG